MNIELNYHAAASCTAKHPLLFVHGMAHAAWCWEWEFVPFFNRKGYDCYTLSFRGHGKSDGHQGIRWHRIKDYLHDLENTISRIPQKPVLIGHSMGGFVIQKYLLKHDNVPGAVTLATVPASGMLKGSLKIARYFPWQFLKGNLMMSTAPFSEDEYIIRTIAFSASAPERLIADVKKNMEPESYMAYLDMLFLDLHQPQAVRTPLLFMYAENDFIVDYEGWKKTADGFGAEQMIVSNIAHDMFLDSKHAEVSDAMLHWLQRLS